MRMIRVFAITSALALGTSGFAVAQEHGKLGITFGYPGDVGVLWHASPSVAIRPAFTFSHTSGESPTSSSTDGWGTGFDVSVLFYLRKYDSVRTYVSPQFTYTHTSTSSTPPTQASVSTITSGSHSNGGAGAFGAQYTPSPHFSVYGEFGLAFASQHATFTGGTITSTSTGTTWGTFAGVGVVFYP